MHNSVPFALAVFVSVAIIAIGMLYVFSPKRIQGGFGLRLPAQDPDTLAWLRLKGIRDIALGVFVLVLMATTNSRVVGTALLVFAVVPFGDMCNILLSKGRRVTAFFVHGLTCIVMLFASVRLIHLSYA